MKKNFKLLFALCCWLGLSPYIGKAQVANYAFSQSVGTYTPITGGTSLVMTDDAIYTATIPSFTFNGAAYTDITISTNGFIVFGTHSYGSTDYNPLSSTAAGPGVIAPFGRDLNAGAIGSPLIRYETIGSETIIQWADVTRYATPGEVLSFQIRLNNTTGAIQVVYGGTITPGTSTTYPRRIKRCC